MTIHKLIEYNERVLIRMDERLRDHVSNKPKKDGVWSRLKDALERKDKWWQEFRMLKHERNTVKYTIDYLKTLI